MVNNGVNCDVSGKPFYSRKQYTQKTHSLANKNDVMKSSKLSNKLIVIIGIIAIIGGIGTYYAKAPHVILATALAIDGIGCNPMEQSVFHIHAHMDVIINGAYFLVPSQIGISDNFLLAPYT
jgi:hypothetical protein